MKNRCIFIGDVHGCFDELKLLLEKVGYNKENDRLIFVGDLINKGPKSLEVVQLAQSLNAECIKGNHELRFIEYVKKNENNRPKWDAIKLQFGENLSRHVDWLDALPMYIEDDDFLVVHAGLHPEKKPAETTEHILANIRTWDGVGVDLNNPQNPAWYSYYSGSKLIVYGHWAVEGLKVRENTIGLDSGCVYGKHLSALVWPSKTIVQVKAKKQYCMIS